MRTIIVYYSFTNTTHRAAHVMMDILKSKGDDVIPVRIRPLAEETNFLKQCRDAFLSKKPELYRTLLDVSKFDRVIIGSPVWAFKPAPAINTYLDKCSTLEGKEALCFVTYGSGVGKDKALESIKVSLEKKGANVTNKLSFQQADGLDKIREEFKKSMGIQ